MQLTQRESSICKWASKPPAPLEKNPCAAGRGFSFARRRRSNALMRQEGVAIFGRERRSGGIGRRAGLRIQWSNPWGFESPLWHGAQSSPRPEICYEEKERDPRFLKKEKRTAAAGPRSPRPHQGSTGSYGAAGENGKASRDIDEVGSTRIVTTTQRSRSDRQKKAGPPGPAFFVAA